MEKLERSEVKQIEFAILKKFAQFCNENQLCYTLAYGTLLGCIRHKGFIPWDDDIDVWMLRDDYNRLLLMKDNFEREFENLSFKSLGDRNYPFAFLKITDNATVVEEKEMEAKYRYGIWIDVFPLDFIPADSKKHEKNRAVIDFWKKILVKSIINGGNIGKSGISKLLNSLFLLPIAHFLGKLIDIPAKCDKKAKKFSGEKNNQVTNYIWENNSRKPVFNIEKIFPCETGVFEGVEFNIL